MQRERSEAEGIVDKLFPKLDSYDREFLIRIYSLVDERYCENCYCTGRVVRLTNGVLFTSSCLCQHVVKRNADVARAFERSNIPSLYAEADVEIWTNMGSGHSGMGINRASHETVLAYAKSLARMREKGHGLFLCGPHGVGKTYLACAIGNAAIRARYQVGYYTMATIIQTHIRGWYEDDAKETVDAIATTDFLIIDDLDKIYKTKTGIETSLFDNLLRSRLQTGLPCVFTSNRTLTKAADDYSPAIHSMLVEHCAELVFTGSDFRARMSGDVRRDILDGGS
jgi:DNA replication protein DnaC